MSQDSTALPERISWFKPLQQVCIIDGEQGRKTTWLELFYDLVFVAALSQLTQSLFTSWNWMSTLWFLAFFWLIWWCWIGITQFKSRYELHPLTSRAFAFVELFGVLLLAVQLPHALGQGQTGFVLTYMGLRYALCLRYSLVVQELPSRRVLSNRIRFGYLLNLTGWALTLGIPYPLNGMAWIALLCADFWWINALLSNAQITTQPNASHLVERMGLFTLIVLGETLLSVVMGLTGSSTLSPGLYIKALLGFFCSFGAWWLYFDNLSEQVVQSSRSHGDQRAYWLWLLSHPVLFMGLSLWAVGLRLEFLSLDGSLVSERLLWLGGGLAFWALAACKATDHWSTCQNLKEGSDPLPSPWKALVKETEWYLALTCFGLFGYWLFLPKPFLGSGFLVLGVSAVALILLVIRQCQSQPMHTWACPLVLPVASPSLASEDDDTFSVVND